MSTLHPLLDYKYDVFICYSRQDIDFVKQVVVELKKFKYRVWRDEEILMMNPGDDYLPHVEEGIKNCRVLLYIHTGYSVVSEFVQERELPYAHEEGVPVIPYAYQYQGKEILRNSWIGRKEIVAYTEEQKKAGLTEVTFVRITVQRFFHDLSPAGDYWKLETSSKILAPDCLQAFLTGESFIWPIPDSCRKVLKENGFVSDLSSDLSIYNRLMIFLNENCSEIKDKDAFLQEIAEKTAYDFLKKKENHKTIFNGPMLGVSSVEASRSADGKETHSLKLGMYRTDYFTFKCMSRLYMELSAQYGRDELFFIRSAMDIPRYAPFLGSLGMGGFLLYRNERTVKTLWVKRSGDCEAGDMYHFSYDETIGVKELKGEKVDLYHGLYRGINEELGLLQSDLSGEGGVFEIGLILTDARIELELLSYIVLEDMDIDQFKRKIDAADDSKLEIGEFYFWDFEEYDRHLTDKILTPESLALIQRLKVRKDEDTLFVHHGCREIGVGTSIGRSTLIEDFVVIGNRANIGKECKIHHFVHIDEDVVIGNRVKIQNNVMIPHGVTLEDGVFVGPSVVFTNDKNPRSVTPDGQLKSGEDWMMTPTLIKEGASLGGGAVIVCGVTIGRWAMVGAGAVVTKDVPDYALVVGCPAKVIGKVNEKGEIVAREKEV